jgi:hypothetical protein
MQNPARPICRWISGIGSRITDESGELWRQTDRLGLWKICTNRTDSGCNTFGPLLSECITDLWKEEIQDAISHAILFADRGDSVIIYGLETGAVVCLDSETAIEKYNKALKLPM